MTLKYDFDDCFDYEYDADVETKELRELISGYVDVDILEDNARKLIDFIVCDLDIKNTLEEFFEDQIKEKHYDEAVNYYAEQKESAQAEKENISEIMNSWH